jgi:hypothetical protein
MKPIHYQRLLEWLHGEREVRSLEIIVTANDPEYHDLDDGDEAVTYTHHYQITAHDIDTYAEDGDGNGLVGVSFVGAGSDLDEAAEHILKSIADRQVTLDSIGDMLSAALIDPDNQETPS